MIKSRRLLVLSAQMGIEDLDDFWESTLDQEPREAGEPVACPECPLLRGRTLHPSASRIAAVLPLERFTCHKSEAPRRCAGAVAMRGAAIGG